MTPAAGVGGVGGVGANAELIAELELSLAAGRLQQALLRETLTRAAGYLDRHSDG